MGMYLMRQIGSRGAYANPILPDFMVFLNCKELPWYWYGFDMFWFAGIMVLLAPKLLVPDEPTEGIQPSIMKDIGHAIRYLRDTGGMAILLVEQYLDFCRELAGQVYIMDRGEIVRGGGAADLDRPEVRRHLMV